MKTLHSIQAYRGFAAILVLLHHTNFIMAKYSMDSPLSQFFQFGHAGVEFFFVLSGFILYHTYCNGNKNCDIKSFLKNRFIRIYPLYWLVTLALLPVWMMRPSYGEHYHREISAIISSFFLLPQTHPPHIIVAWSLTHEIMFYLFFLLTVINRKAGLVASGLVFTLIFFFNIFVSNHSFPELFYLSKYNLLFLIGIFTGIAISKINMVKKSRLFTILLYSFFLVGNSLFLWFGILDNSLPIEGKYTWFFGIASAMIIIGSCSHGINIFFSKCKTALFVGAASYSIYLIHIFVIEFLCKRISSINVLNIPPNLSFLLLTFAGIVAGIILYVTAEKRMLLLLKKQRQPLSKAIQY